MWEENRSRIAANTAGDGPPMNREPDRSNQRLTGRRMWRAQKRAMSVILPARNAASSMLSTAQQSTNVKVKKEKRTPWREGGSSGKAESSRQSERREETKAPAVHRLTVVSDKSPKER